MKRSWVLVMDSGIGGLWTLEKIRKLCPKENYIYFMDKLHAPYGDKPSSKLKRITVYNIKKLTNLYDIKLIVFACNTLSSVCEDVVKQKFPNIPVVKIEPFFNPNIFSHQNTLVLATKNTIKRNKKLQEYLAYENIFMHGFGKLARMIDDAKGDYDKLLPFLQMSLSKYKNQKIKNIVLGCTHFNYIKPQLKKIFGDVKFFENSENVAKSVKKALKTTKNKSNSQKNAQKKQKSSKFLLLYKL